MRVLEANAYAILELVAARPISFFPPIHLTVVEDLSKQGLVRFDGQRWHPTGIGLMTIGRTLH